MVLSLLGSRRTLVASTATRSLLRLSYVMATATTAGVRRTRAAQERTHRASGHQAAKRPTRHAPLRGATGPPRSVYWPGARLPAGDRLRYVEHRGDAGLARRARASP